MKNKQTSEPAESQQASETDRMEIEFPVYVMPEEPAAAPIARKAERQIRKRLQLLSKGMSLEETNEQLAPEQQELKKMQELYKNNRKEYLKKYL